MTAESVQSTMPPRWQLTAPESHVLQYRGGCYRDEPFKLAVKELVTRRVLRVERRQRGRLPGRTPQHVLVDGPLIASEVPRPLTAVLGVYRKALSRSPIVLAGSTHPVPVAGVSTRDLRQAAREEFGAVKRYHVREVVPVLVERGLLTYVGSRGLKHEPDYDWTGAGRQADAELDQWMALGRRDLARWTAEGNLVKSAAYVKGAGAVVLLMPDLYRELLMHDLRMQRAAVQSGFLDGGSDTRDGLHLDFGDLDLDLGGVGGLVGDFGGGGDGGGGGG